MDIFIKTVDGRVSERKEISLIMDDEGMKYIIRDRNNPEVEDEHRLDVEIPNHCRSEIMRRHIPCVDAKTGVLYKDAKISPVLSDFIFGCWYRILTVNRHL